MYQILCDGQPLYDPYDDDLTVLNPRCKLEVNTVGEASFTISKTHKNFNFLQKLKSVFEIRQGGDVIFRGRMTNDSKDFYNQLFVDLEGVLGFTNDTLVPPYVYLNGFIVTQGTSVTVPPAITNAVEKFLWWIIYAHNMKAQPWQKLTLGTVTVTKEFNFELSSTTEYITTWETIKTKLVDKLGGYIVIRYEDGGNYVDYLSEFPLTNDQEITFGENLLDITTVSDATDLCTVIAPMGKDGLTIKDLPDGDIGDGYEKEGAYIYHRENVEKYGWICVPPTNSKWDDVEEAATLQTSGKGFLNSTAMKLANTITIKAADLYFTDERIAAFRIYRKVRVNSPMHGLLGEPYELTVLDIDLFNPQNTDITLGETTKSLIDINRQQQSMVLGTEGNLSTETAQLRQALAQTNADLEQTKADLQDVENELTTSKEDVLDLKTQLTTQSTQLVSDFNTIVLSALESYVETSNFEEFRETISTQLQILSDEILMHFNTVSEHIVDVDGDLQTKFTEIYKYISFSGGAITLGSSESAITLTIESDRIVFKKDGLQFGWWNGVDFHTGNIVVEVNEKAQFGTFAWMPRADKSLMFLKVGG